MSLNNKGFTLIEIIVTVGILGVITLIAFPAILSLQASNTDTKYEAYMDLLASNSRVYIDNYEKDIFPNKDDNKCFVIDYDTLFYNDLIKEFDVDGVSCDNSDTFVKVSLEDGNYSYEPSLNCKNENDEITYDMPKEEIDISVCPVIDFISPQISIVSDSPESWSKNHEYYIEVADSKSGLSDNIVIEYGWGKNGNVPTSYTRVEFSNNYGVDSVKTEITSTNDQDMINDKNGVWELFVRPVENIFDTEGNSLEVGVITKQEFFIDNTNPVTPILDSSHDDNKYVGNWTNQSFSLKLISSDNESGIKNWKYSYDGIDWKEYSNSSMDVFETTDFSLERNSPVYISACDYVGLCSSNYTSSILIDKDSPLVATSKVRYNSSSGTIRSNTDTSYSSSTLWWGEFSATDTGSGINRYEYSSGCTGNKTNNLGVSYTYSNNVNATFCIRAVDNAGNTGEWSGPTYIRVNKSPAVPIVSNPTNGNWVNYNYSLTIKAGDSVPVTHYQYSYDNKTFYSYSDSAKTTYVTPAIAAEQNRPIYIRACVNTSCSASTYTYLRIDKTKPTIPSVSAKTTNGANFVSYNQTDAWTSQNIIVTLNSTDAGSGISYYRYYRAYTYNVPLDQIPLTAPNQGINQIHHQIQQHNSFHYIAFDKAGNMSDVTWPGRTDWVWINIDRTKPTVSFTKSSGTYSASGGIYFDVNAHDSFGSIREIVVHIYKVVNGAYQIYYTDTLYNTTVMNLWLPPGNYFVAATAFDKAGNRHWGPATDVDNWETRTYNITSYPANSCKIRGNTLRNANITWQCEDGVRHWNTQYYQKYCTDSNGNLYIPTSNKWVCAVAPYGAESGWIVIND